MLKKLKQFRVTAATRGTELAPQQAPGSFCSTITYEGACCGIKLPRVHHPLDMSEQARGANYDMQQAPAFLPHTVPLRNCPSSHDKPTTFKVEDFNTSFTPLTLKFETLLLIVLNTDVLTDVRV